MESTPPAKLAALRQHLSDLLVAIRSQLEAAAAQVEREAEAVTAEVGRVHALARTHRANASAVFERLRASSRVPLGVDPDRLVEEIFGTLREYTAQLEAELSRQDQEHGELLGHTRPLISGLQMFDAIRQLIEHSAAALTRVDQILARLPEDAGLVATSAELERLLQTGLREVYFTEAERRTLGELVPGAFNGDEHFRPTWAPSAEVAK